MPAEELSISECNQGQIAVFLDANVVIAAIRDAGRPNGTFARMTLIHRGLRMFASTTLFEVAFARRGTAASTLRENQEWLRAHATHVPLTEPTARRFERLMTASAQSIRGRADLGDALLAAYALREAGRPCAIATNDADFRALPVRLVSEFLPPP